MTEDEIARAKAVANFIRANAPDLAEKIEKALRDATRHRVDGMNIKIGFSYRIEKYDGEFDPTKAPVEIIEGNG